MNSIFHFTANKPDVGFRVNLDAVTHVTDIEIGVNGLIARFKLFVGTREVIVDYRFMPGGADAAERLKFELDAFKQDHQHMVDMWAGVPCRTTRSRGPG